MALVKDRHNSLFKTKIDELRSDIGRDIEIWTSSEVCDCTWCIFDEMSQKSAGIPQEGKVWSNHPNYAGTDIYCPNCFGEGIINIPEKTSITDVIIADSRNGVEFFRDKLGIIPEGTKILIGKLSDILTDTFDVNSTTIFANALKVIVDGEDYRVKSINKFGLKDNYLFETKVERTNPTDENIDALTS